MGAPTWRDGGEWLKDPKLWEHATERQRMFIEAVQRLGTMHDAARELKVSPSVISESLKCARERASVMGYAPEHGLMRTVAPGYVGKGHSTLDRINEDGSRTPVLQWTKTKADEEARARLIEAGFAAAAEALPRVAAVPAPAVTIASLANVVTITDFHLGMRAWAPESGAAWDIDTAERMLVASVEHLITNAPKARKVILNIQGDFLHADGPKPLTPTSGHLLDVAGQYAEVVKAAIRALRRAVDCALIFHEQVTVLFCEGNHDIQGSMWLRYMFAALYENEPRVTVHDSERPYYAIQHGKTMLGFHHGHLKKNDALPLVFAASFPEMWGLTVHRYVHTGHEHHAEEKEHAGITIRRHRTIAPNDAHSARHGYLSERAADCATYHDVYGEVGRNFVTPEMLADAA